MEAMGSCTASRERNTPPDFDLHVYAIDGRHVGTNYLTGEFETGIPGAMVSSNRSLARGWIFLPENVEAYFVLSTHDLFEFASKNLEALENENMVYTLRIDYFDGNANQWKSENLLRMVAPGEEIAIPYAISLQPDGTYSVKIEPGINMSSLEALCETIESIPDEFFINQPSNRKTALRNKMRAVFNKLAENDYQGAIDKLQDDILERLDADGKADWVKRPVLVYELKAFIGYLRYRKSQVTCESS